MKTVVPFEPRARRAAAPDPVAEDSHRALIVFVVVFSAIALVMYTAAVLAASTSHDERLWLIWLVFVIAITKVLLANGLLFLFLQSDAHSKARSRPRGVSRTPPDRRLERAKTRGQERAQHRTPRALPLRLVVGPASSRNERQE